MAQTIRQILRRALTKAAEHIAYCAANEPEMLPLAAGVMRELLTHPQAAGPDFEMFRLQLDKLTEGMTVASREIVEHYVVRRLAQARRDIEHPQTIH